MFKTGGIVLVAEAVKKAVQERDFKKIAIYMNYFRFKLRMNYFVSCEAFKKCAGIDADEFEGLCVELDEAGL